MTVDMIHMMNTMDGTTAPPAEGEYRLRGTLQARVLNVLMPTDIEAPSYEWPLLTRTQLNKRAGFTAKSGSITRALNGIRATNKTSGVPHPGLVELGMIEVTTLDIDGMEEDNYRITKRGIEALLAFVARGGKIPPVKDPIIYTNLRYEPKVVVMTQ